MERYIYCQTLFNKFTVCESKWKWNIFENMNKWIFLWSGSNDMKWQAQSKIKKKYIDFKIQNIFREMRKISFFIKKKRSV